MPAVEGSPTQSRAWALGAVAVAVAAIAFDPTAASASTPKIALALVVALGALAPTLPRLWRDRVAPPSGVLLWLALAGWSLLALAWSPTADPTIPALWLAAGGIALATSGLDPTDRRTFTGRSATLVTAASSLAVLVQWATGAEGIARHGTMGNPNWLGLSLACALPLVLGHAVHRGGFERAAAIAAAALGVAGLVLAQSRVAFVALAVVAVAVAITRSKRPRRALLVGVTLTIVLAIVAARAWAEPLAGRLYLASIGADAWRAAPLFGHGSGAFTSAYLSAQGAALHTLPVDEAARQYLFVTTAHGDWVQLAVEGGLVAIASGLLTVALAITTCRASNAASVGVVALCMLGDAPLRQPAVVLLLALALADTPPLPRKHDRRDPLFALAVTVALACLLPRATTQWLAERTAHPAHDAEPAERLLTLERARRMAPWWSTPAFDAGLTALELGEPERALTAFDEAARAGMIGPTLHVARGNALVVARRHREAISSYEAALRLHPASFRAHANLSEAARLAGDLGKAERHLALARDLQPHHPKLAAIADALRKRVIHEATSAAHDEAGESR